MSWLEKIDKSQKDKELAKMKEYLQVILTLEKTCSNLYTLKAKKQDNTEHQVVYSPWLFHTRALYKARKQLLDEIELLSGKQTFIVTEFITL